MPEPFAGVASIDYPIVDADAHVYEPPDVWQARVPQALRTRAPRLQAGPDGDVWLFDDGARIRPIGLMAAAIQKQDMALWAARHDPVAGGLRKTVPT